MVEMDFGFNACGSIGFSDVIDAMGVDVNVINFNKHGLGPCERESRHYSMIELCETFFIRRPAKIHWSLTKGMKQDFSKKHCIIKHYTFFQKSIGI